MLICVWAAGRERKFGGNPPLNVTTGRGRGVPKYHRTNSDIGTDSISDGFEGDIYGRCVMFGFVALLGMNRCEEELVYLMTMVIAVLSGTRTNHHPEAALLSIGKRVLAA